VLYNFEPDFGSFEVYEFGMGAITSVRLQRQTPFTSVYPNPATDHLTVIVKNSGNNPIKLQLMNSMNSLMMEKSVTTHEDTFRTDLIIGDLPSGIYLLKIESDNFSTVRKIVKK